MQKYLIAIGIILIISFHPLTAKSDSLQQVIDHGTRFERIEARLEMAFRSRINNFELSRSQALAALREMNTPEARARFEARGYYYLGMAYYYHSQADSALHYFVRAEQLAKEKKEDRLLGQLYHLMGITTQTFFGDQIRAIQYYDLSIHHSMIANNHRALGAVYSDLSNLLRSNAAYEKALEYIFRAREYYQKADFTEGEAWVLYLIGILYNSIYLYDESIHYFQEAEQIYRKLSEKDGIMRGVAISLDQLASVNIKLGNTETARNYLAEAMELHGDSGSRFGLSTSLKYLADLEFREGNFEEALNHLDRSLTIKKEINNITGFPSIYELYGLFFIETEQYRRALDSLNIGLAYALENNQLRHVMDMNKHLSGIYYKLGDFEKAFALKSQQVAIADSIYSADATRNLMQLETLQQIEDKEKIIRDLEHENRIQDILLSREKSIRTYLTSIASLSLIIVLLLVYLYYEKIRAHKILKKSKAYVDEINASKDKLFSIIAHDLRGPFNSMFGFSDLLQKNSETYEHEKMKKMISLMHGSVHKSYNLLNNLLEWSRSQTGILQFNPVPLHMDEVLSEVLNVLSEQIEQKKIQVEHSAGPLSLTADHNMLQTILRNLVTNAVKFSYPGGKIYIGWQKEEDSVKIWVSDQGIGIAKASQESLFRIAESYHVDGTAGEKGSGLGLIICKEFVEKHGGAIRVESEPGKGSTFYFTIKQS
ncbi:MAG: tetratricopeptide repeat-containing sensor histidine kinase [FCB group bacterium]|nr:tetratricopeptide repeat-containing sensor histidine kinase [FCB group bacterium]